MFNILTRYLAREVSLHTGMVLVALVLLFGFFELIQELNDLGKGNYRFADILMHVLLSMPSSVYNIFPAAALIGTMLALSRLASHSELTVMRASGMSLGSIALALMAVGVVFALLTLVFGEMITPAAERAAQELKMRATESLVGREFRSGVWVKDEGNVVNVKAVQIDADETRLLEIRVYEFDEEKRLKSISFAQSGTYLGNNQWKLVNAHKTLFTDGRTEVKTLPELTWKTVLTPDILSVLLIKPEQMSAVNLFTYIQHLRDNAQRSTRYEIAIWTKLIYPSAVLTMMLLAVPFSVGSQRGGGVGKRLLIGILLGLAFNLANRLFSSLGQLNEVSPFASAALPTIIMFCVAIGLLAWTERKTSGARFLGFRTA